MTESPASPAEQLSLHDRIAVAARNLTPGQCDQIEVHGGIVKLYRENIDTSVANCVGTVEFSAGSGDSNLNVHWHAQYCDSGSRLGMDGDKTVNHRRRATGNASELNTIEVPTIEQLLDMLEKTTTPPQSPQTPSPAPSHS